VQDLVRRHRVMFGWVVFLFIGVPMVLWTVPNAGGPANPGDRTVIDVGGVPVLESELRRNLSAVAAQRAGAGERPTYAELDEDGTAAEVLESMVSAALIRHEREAKKIALSEKFLAEQLRKDTMFKTEDGKFDHEAWNEWVLANQERGLDWNEVYTELSESLSHGVFLDLIQAAGGRVDDSEIEYQLNDDYTKLKIRYLQVKPPFSADGQELRDYYDANAEDYREPDSKIGQYVVKPLAPAVPADALDIVAQARGGADFAELANTRSKQTTSDGGDMGWRRASEAEPAFRQPIFSMAVGEVSEPVPAPNGFYIYKVEEERMVPMDAVPAEDGSIPPAAPDAEMVREVRARQIFIEAALTDDERKAIQDDAVALADRAKELGTLEAAAQEAGLELKETAAFTDLSPEIAGIPMGDVFEFRKAFSDEELEAFNVIPARDNIYVAVLKERVEGVLPPYEDVVERVKTDVERTEAFRDKIAEYAEKIKTEATSIAMIQEKFPELREAPKETDFFTRKDFLFQQQFYVQPRQIYEEIGRAPIGTMAGPLEDFQGEQFFVELLDRQEPTEEDKAKWPEEKETLRTQIAMRSRMEVLEDYALFLNQTKLPNLRLTYDNDALNQILERDLDGTVLLESDPVAEAAQEIVDGAASDTASETPAESAAPEVAAPAADLAVPAQGDGLPQE